MKPYLDEMGTPSTEVELELILDRPADSGAAVGRDDQGRVAFVDGGLAGERVRVEVTEAKKRHVRASVIEVLEPSPHRIVPACPTLHSGCGGCDLAHATPAHQREVKLHVVRDSLQRIGRLSTELVDEVVDPVVRVPGQGEGYRTTVRTALADGRASYRRRRDHAVVPVQACGVTHRLIEELLVEARFEPSAGDSAMFRASVATGERMIVIDGDPVGVSAPGDVDVVTRKSLDAGVEAYLFEEAAGRRWRVSADSFFQAGPTVATALVDTVRELAGPVAGQRIVDAYAGIGLFAGTIGSDAAHVTAVERSGSSTRDARVNLDDGVEIVESDVDRWTSPPAADLVIADPPRNGLGRGGVDVLTKSRAERFVLVSCDPGSLGRDIALLGEAGYSPRQVVLVDAFADTSHVETVVLLGA